MDLNQLHLLIEIIATGGSLAGVVIMLIVKNKQAEVKEVLTDKINQTSQAIAVHAARDEEKFISIDDKLERIDGKLDRVNGR